MSTDRPDEKQNGFIGKIIKCEKQVSVFLRSGIQLRGTITAFDQYVIVLADNTTAKQLIYKHAISTILYL